MNRLFALIAALGLLAVGAAQLSAHAQPAGWARYDAAEFVMAQKKGRTIVVALAAERCPPCRANVATLEALRREGHGGAALFVTADYAADEAFVRDHRVAEPGSVLVFRGMDEIARTAGDGEAQALRAAVLEAL